MKSNILEEGDSLLTEYYEKVPVISVESAIVVATAGKSLEMWFRLNDEPVVANVYHDLTLWATAFIATPAIAYYTLNHLGQTAIEAYKAEIQSNR